MSRSDSSRESTSERLRRATVGALGWLATALGFLAILWIVAGGTPEWLFSWGGGAVAIAIGASALAPILLGLAYRIARARVRAAEATGHADTGAPRAQAAQSAIAAMLDSVHAASGDVLGLERQVHADRVRLTAATVAGFADRAEALSFMWTVRPAQPDGYPDSPQFLGLPDWARHAVVLLDLRRSIGLRGGTAALTADTGFYRHPRDRMLIAAGATGNDDLVAALRVAAATADHGEAPDDDPAFTRLRSALDDARTWARIID